MIHVEVGEAPEEFRNAKLHKLEVDALRTWLSYPADMRPPAPVPAGRYRSVSGLMDKLEAAFEHKCAFCESGVPLGEGKIMFYRPVGSRGVRIDTKAYFYPWLAWDWSNFFLACRDCVEVREAGFKVVRKAIPDLLHVEQENAANYAGLEEPYLLNPRIDTPIMYLEFNKNGEVLAREGAERGQYTIAHLKLNRPSLVRRRKEESQEFKQHWLAARTAFLADSAGGAPNAPELTSALAALAAQCQRSTPFAGMKACLLLEWLAGENFSAAGQNDPFTGATERAPWLHVYQVVTATLGITMRSSLPVHGPPGSTVAAGQIQVDSPSTHTSVSHFYINGDMYQIGSIIANRVTVGSSAATSYMSRDPELGGRTASDNSPTKDSSY